MSELWEALLDVDRALPVWWRYVATAGGSIALYGIIPRLWRWLHSRQKPFRCGPLVWKRSNEGDVYAGINIGPHSYPLWASGTWVENDAPFIKEQVDDTKDSEEDQPAAD